VASPRREELALFAAERRSKASADDARKAVDPFPVTDLKTGETYLVTLAPLWEETETDWNQS
jgi:hypothetical protein